MNTVPSPNKYLIQLQYEQNRYYFQMILGQTDQMKIINNGPGTDQSVYRFNELPNGGVSSYVGHTGMTWTAFRASDDFALFMVRFSN